MKRVMVVDDDPMVCILCKRLLTEAGYEAITQPSGTRCMLYLRNPENPPVQLIVLDVEMPSMNGFKTLASIRESKTFNDIPVMFLTSLCSSDTVAQAKSFGIREYLKKPFHNEDFIRRVEWLLADVPDNEEPRFADAPADGDTSEGEL